MKALAVGLVFTLGCGRVGFGLFASSSGTPDGGASDATPDAPPDALGTGADAGLCAAASHVSIDIGGGGTWVTSVSAVKVDTDTGVLYVAPDANQFVATYTPTVPDTTDTAVGASGSIAISAISVSAAGDILTSSTLTSNMGTELAELAHDLTAASAPITHAGQIAVAVPLAVSGGGFAFAFNAGGLAAAGEIDATPVTAAGVFTGTTKAIANAAEMPMVGALATANNGYLLTYLDAAGASAITRATLLDTNLDVVAGPTNIGNATHGDEFQPRGVWASTANVYLFAWSELDAAATPNLWFEIRDAALAPLVPPRMIGPGGSYPKLASDGASFWIAWGDAGITPTGLSAAHVTADGVADVRAIIGTGGTAVDYDVVDALTGVQLVWFEKNGATPTTPLWIMPAGSCAL